MPRVADVSERIEDLSDIPDADIERMKAIRDAARPWDRRPAARPRGSPTPEQFDKIAFRSF